MAGYSFLKYLKELIGADSSSGGEAVEQHISSSAETQGQDVHHKNTSVAIKLRKVDFNHGVKV